MNTSIGPADVFVTSLQPQRRWFLGCLKWNTLQDSSQSVLLVPVRVPITALEAQSGLQRQSQLPCTSSSLVLQDSGRTNLDPFDRLT
jgi:hypothetical protein